MVSSKGDNLLVDTENSYNKGWVPVAPGFSCNHNVARTHRFLTELGQILQAGFGIFAWVVYELLGFTSQTFHERQT